MHHGQFVKETYRGVKKCQHGEAIAVPPIYPMPGIQKDHGQEASSLLQDRNPTNGHDIASAGPDDVRRRCYRLAILQSRPL
jgi:hypothetical protein